MNYERTLIDLSDALAEPPETAEFQIERKVDSIVRELDELCAMAVNPETVDLVDGQRPGIGQIISRAQLIGAFLMARNPSKFRVISNG